MTTGNERGRPARTAGSAATGAWVPLVLVALFVVPIVIAWLYATGTLNARDRGLLNRGTLLEPPIDLSGDELTGSLPRSAGLEPGEWAMLYLHTGPCDQPCGEDLSKLLTIRAVLGRDGTRVRVLALLAHGGTEPVTIGDRSLIDAGLYGTVVANIRSRERSVTFPCVVLFDWRGQMIMQYERDTAPADIKSDLKRLLKGSRIDG